MRELRFVAGIAVIAVGLSAGVAVADGPPPGPAYPPGYLPAYMPTVTYDWSGIYIGGSAGAAYADKSVNFDRIVDPNCFIFGPCDPTSSFRSNGLDFSATSFAGGGFVGLQKQWSWLVLGAEAGYLWMNPSVTSGFHLGSTLLGTPDLVVTASGSVRNLYLVTGKLGWAWENMLAYFKGGWASADVESRFISSGTLISAGNGRENGWTASAGLEYALKEHLIIGVEYTYVEITPAARTQDVVPTTTVRGHIESGIDIQSVTARLSFKFGGHN